MASLIKVTFKWVLFALIPFLRAYANSEATIIEI